MWSVQRVSRWWLIGMSYSLKFYPLWHILYRFRNRQCRDVWGCVHCWWAQDDHVLYEIHRCLSFVSCHWSLSFRCHVVRLAINCHKSTFFRRPSTAKKIISCSSCPCSCSVIWPRPLSISTFGARFAHFTSMLYFGWCKLCDRLWGWIGHCLHPPSLHSQYLITVPLFHID